VTRVGFVTSWGCRCGIAEYTKALVESLDATAVEPVVFADQERDLPDDDSALVFRCWRRGSDDVRELIGQLRSANLDVVVLEFNWGYLNPGPLGVVLEALAASGTPTVVEFHSTDDRSAAGQQRSLADVAEALGTARLLIAHSDAAANALRGIASGVPVAVTTLGQQSFPDQRAEEVREALGLDGRAPVIASFGFLFPHKGVVEIIRATNILRARHDRIVFLAVCAVIPTMAASLRSWRECQAEIGRLGLAGNVSLITAFLPQPVAMTLLHAADVVVLPYHRTAETASAAARFALSSSRPVLTTAEPIFDALGESVMRLDDSTPEAIARGVELVLADPSMREGLITRAAESVTSCSWQRVADVFLGLLNDVLGESPTEART